MERTSAPTPGVDFVDVPEGRLRASVGGWLWHLHHAGLLPRDREVTVYGHTPTADSRNPGRWHGQRSCQLIGRRVGKIKTTIGDLMDTSIPAGSVYLLCECMDRSALRWAAEPICGDIHEPDGTAECSNLGAFKAAGLALQWLRATDEIAASLHVYPELLTRLTKPPYAPELHPALRDRIEARRALRYSQLDKFATRRDIQIRFLHSVCDKLATVGEENIEQLVDAFRCLDVAAIGSPAVRFLVEDTHGNSRPWDGTDTQAPISFRYTRGWAQLAEQWMRAALAWRDATSTDVTTDWEEVDRIRVENGLEPIADRYEHSACGKLHAHTWKLFTEHTLWVWRGTSAGVMRSNKTLMINLDQHAESPAWKIPLAAALLDIAHMRGVDTSPHTWKSRSPKLLGWEHRATTMGHECFVIGSHPGYTREGIEMAARVSPEKIDFRSRDLEPADRVAFHNLVLAAAASID